MTPLQIALITLVAIVIVGVIIAVILNQEAQRKRRMMTVIAGKSGSGQKKISESEEQNKRRAEITKKLKESKEEENEKKPKATISMKIAQAGLDITTRQFWIFSVFFMVAAVIVGQLLGQPPFVLVMVAVTALLGVPRFVLKFLAGRRQKKFLEEFPDALEAMVRLLKAGMPVSEAIAMISREFEGPVGEEMSRVYDKQKIGIPLHEAALECTKRMPLTEMQMFATGLAIQAQTGSSLSEVLINLSSVIRARFRLKRKVKALSAEAIASASIIGALPNLVAGGMYFANREYIMVLFTDPFGKILLTGAVIWMCIGIFVMKVMINFKV